MSAIVRIKIILNKKRENQAGIRMIKMGNVIESLETRRNKTRIFAMIAKTQPNWRKKWHKLNKHFMTCNLMKVAIVSCQTSKQGQEMQRAYQNQLNSPLIRRY